MKYVIRALKYFVYITVLLSILLIALVLLKIVSSDINEIFREGWGSVIKLLMAFLAISFVYPRIGYTKRGVRIPGEYSEIRKGVIDFMESRGYELEKEEGEDLSFRLRNKFNRLTRVWEDRVTFTRDYAGFYVEGISKDLARLISGLEFQFRNPEN